VLAQGVSQVIVFVDDPEAAAAFWAEALGTTRDTRLPLINVRGIELFFHESDPEKSPPGASTVVYWRVDDFDAARQRLLDLGCEAWRGPIDIGEGRRICQLRDPFGVVVGLDGR